MTRDAVPSQTSELWRALEAAEVAAPVDAVDAVTRELAVELGTDRVTFLIADLAGRTLVRLSHTDRPARAGERGNGEERASTVLFSSGRVGRTLQDQTPTVEQDGDDWRVLAPVSQRGEVLGLLEVVLDRRPDGDLLELIGQAARMLAYVVIANRRHTDLFEWGQRSVPFTLSAELQRRLLPAAFTCEAREFTLSAWLEPSATIGGDTFDYSINRDTLYLSVTDAMGHGVDAALIASVAVGALRNSRRRGDDLTTMVSAANVAVATHCPGTFCTGLICQVDLATGVVTVVNAGHVTPILLRDGTAHDVSLAIDLPLGINADTVYHPDRIALQPGDRFVIVTDGMTERSASEVDLKALIEQSAELHPREATRQLADGVTGASPEGLLDDATILLFDWRGRDDGEPA